MVRIYSIVYIEKKRKEIFFKIVFIRKNNIDMRIDIYFIEIEKT